MIFVESQHARESRLRRLATSQDLIIRKSRSRTWQHPEFGLWHIVDSNNLGVAGFSPWAHSLTLDEVEDYLTEES